MLGREERLEDPLADVGGDARTVVGDGDGRRQVVGADRDGDAAVGAGGLRRVQQQVEEDGPHLIAVQRHDRAGPRDRDAQRGVRRIPAQQRRRVLDQRGEIDRRQLRLARPGEHQQVLDDVVERIDSRDRRRRRSRGPARPRASGRG